MALSRNEMMRVVVGMVAASLQGDTAGFQALEDQAISDPRHFVVVLVGTLEHVVVRLGEALGEDPVSILQSMALSATEDPEQGDAPR